MYELQLEETKVKTDHDFRTNGKSQLLRNAVRTATHLLSVYLSASGGGPMSRTHSLVIVL